MESIFKYSKISPKNLTLIPIIIELFNIN